MEIDSIIKIIDGLFKTLDFEKNEIYDLQKRAPGYNNVRVIKSVIYKDKNSNLRYRILIEYDLPDGEKSKKALFIMKNPSMADKNKSDRTVNKILETACFLKYSKVYIMNLFPEYSSKPCDININHNIEEILVEHDKLIESVSNNVTCVFVAWGTNDYYKKDIKDFYNGRLMSVKKKLQKVKKDIKIRCQHYNNDNEPTHPAARKLEYKWVVEKEECAYLPWPNEKTKG